MNRLNLGLSGRAEGASMSVQRSTFPFTAIVGQDQLKTALILNAVNPKIGGVLIRGQKGTGKSLAVRALAEVLPEIELVPNHPFNCSPKDPTLMCEQCLEKHERGENTPIQRRRMRVVTLPIGSTEDRVIGSLDIERAIKEGVRSMQPGILAEANQNILYIDEVNLLPDHIIDDILDAAASGWNVVEREAVSMAHPSRFILIGTMNPEEGELRPQLLDRFALHVDVVGVFDQKQRVEIIERNMEFAEDPRGFSGKFREQQDELKKKILNARELLPKVTVPNKMLQVVAQAMIQLQVDGHRPDIVTTASAKALAAFNGRAEVLPQDVLAVAEMAQGHRTRRGGAEEPATSEEIRSAFTKAFGPEVST